jgi:hypothetical protein
MDMEGIVMILVLIIGFVGLDLAALRWGADSRPHMTDDHVR